MPPARIALEQSVPCSAPFDDPDWRFSVDWAGMRVVLAAGADGPVRLRDERLREVGHLVPEVTSSARTALRGRSLTLEGVVAVLDGDGCPDLPALAARLWGPQRDRPPPAALLLTDVLHVDGAAVTAWPFDRRREALCSLVDPVPHLQVPDWVEGEGVSLAEAAAARGLPAVVARLGRSRYHPGVASRERLRIALADEADCVVVAVVTTPGGAVRALRLAEHEGGRLVDAGSAPVDGAAARAAGRRVEELRSPGCPVTDAAAAEPGTVWLRPELVATVRFHGRGGDGRVRLPSLVALREDVAPAACVRRQPVDPPSGRGGGGFRPTVLVTLPFGD